MKRREFVCSGLVGFGGMLVGGPAGAASTASLRHHAARAERVIFLHMSGGPSSVDLLDPKPELMRRNGEPAPESFFATQKLAFTKGKAKLLGSRYTFTKHGNSGLEVSNLLQHIAGCADQMTVIRSMQTDQFNHAPAQLVLNTGSATAGRASLGSWLSWALPTLNPKLPAYVVMFSGGESRFGEAPWVNGFLPASTRGVTLLATNERLPFLADPAGVTRQQRRATLDLAAALQRADGSDDARQRQAQMELAYGLQEAMPEATDLSHEPAAVLAAYGAVPGAASFANNCLTARRLAERGVRCVHLVDNGWDHHGIPGQRIDIDLPRKCKETDQATAALLRDLGERGLLASTLLVWTGEFGRTPFQEQPGGHIGRDHNPRCFTMWMAGGGLKPGVVYGQTDELGWDVVENPVSVNDLNATLLHLLGFDHERLTYRFSGRDFRLTDVSGRVVRPLLA